MAAALHPRRKVERLPDGHLRDVAAVLIHVRRGARHHELVEVVTVVRDVAADLQHVHGLETQFGHLTVVTCPI